MKDNSTDIAKKIKFLREYYPNFREWKRKELTDEQIIYKVFQNFMDTFLSLLHRKEAERLGENKYLIKNKSYLSWLDQYYIRDILKWRYGLEIVGEEEIKDLKIMECPISSETTGMSFYDGMMKNPEYYKKEKRLTFEIKYMSPDDYLKKCYEMHKEYSKKLGKEIMPYDSYLKELIYPELVNKYVSMMKEGTIFDMPVIDYSQYIQEGRHRAMAAKEFGCEKIPVMIVKEYNALKEEKEPAFYYQETLTPGEAKQLKFAVTTPLTKPKKLGKTKKEKEVKQKKLEKYKVITKEPSQAGLDEFLGIFIIAGMIGLMYMVKRWQR